MPVLAPDLLSELRALPPGWQKVTYAADQPEYQPLTVLRSTRSDGAVVSAWRLSWGQRLRLLLTGRVWLTQLTFSAPLQPVLLHDARPEYTLRAAERLV